MNIDINKVKTSNDLALLLGMFAGDGCLSLKHNGNGHRIYPISFYNTNKLYVELFQKLFLKLFNIKGKIYSRERKDKQILWRFEKYSVKMYKIFNEDFEIPNGKKAPVVRIPFFILNGNDNLKKNFFVGLLITDGGLRKDKTIIFHSSSKQLILDLQRLVLDIWNIDRKIKSYVQRERFNSFQLNLNKEQSSIILTDLLRSHNSVLRGF